MSEKRDILCVQISRGLAPAISIASTVSTCCARKIDYRLLTGMTAPAAKQEAARLAYESGRDLILCEDDFLAEKDVWDKATSEGDDVLVGSAIMRNGEINVWFHGERMVYSGTVFVRIPWTALDAIGSPWFVPRNLSFDGSGAGAWMDNGPNEQGLHSDTWFYYRCWESGVTARVCGFVTHLLHPLNNTVRELNIPDAIKPMGMMDCCKTSEQTIGENK